MENKVAPPPSKAANEGGKLHIVMFPWLAFGHMIPYMELSKLLAQKGQQISFVSTPRNIDRQPKLPPNLVPYINFVKLSLPQTLNLPENAEATSDVPYDRVKYLKIAYDGLQEPFAKFLETSSPDWIFHDFSPYWLKPIADRLNIPTVFFSIFIASFLGFLGLLQQIHRPLTPEDFIVPPKSVPFETNISYKYFEIMRIFDHSVSEEDVEVTDILRFEVAFRESDLFVVRSSNELEPQWLNVIENTHKKPVIPVGQLPTTTHDESGESENDKKEWIAIKHWLDQQLKGSVVYVAFGSEAKPSQAEVTAIAHGLEKSEFPFFWVLRKQLGSTDTELTELPNGFEKRMKGRGVISTSWAPQFKILSHDSVGGFLTHSGWSSVVEAMQFGRVLVVLTFLSDQAINARLLEEKGMGYSIPRDNRDGSFTSDSVAESLRLVMIEEEGKKYREKVKEMKMLFGDKDKQDHYVDNLLDFLQNYTKHALRRKEDGPSSSSVC